MTIFNAFLSAFRNSTSENANLFAKPRDTHPVGFFFYLFQLLEFSEIFQECTYALNLG